MDKIKMLFKKIYICVFIFVFIFSIAFLVILDKKAMPVIMSYASVQTKRIGIEVLRNIGTNEVNELINATKLFDVIKDNTGKIESIDFNTALLNEALVVVSKNVRKRLKEVEKGENLPDELYENINAKKNKKGIIYEVPIGVVFGNSFFSNIGPKLPVRIKYSGNVGLDVKTRVSEYGLNSALIEIYIYIEVTQRTILPFQSDEIKLTSEIPVIMKVIKGDVPDYFNGQTKSYSLPME